MYKYFVPTPATLDELKAQYRKLAMLHHPDRGGDLDTMKAINNEHDTIFEMLKAGYNATADADHQTTETAEEFRDILEVLMNLDGLEIELCGAWLWISGNTLAHKDALKAAGCGWSSNKKMWYWRHPENAGRYHKSKSTMTDIRAKYGSERIYGNHQNTATIGATA